MYTLLPLFILFAPLAAATLLLFFGRRLPRGGDWLAIGTLGLTALAAGVLFAEVVVGGAAQTPAGAPLSLDFFAVGAIHFPMGQLVDPLSVTMALVVTVLSTAVLTFSVYYMHGDEMYDRYFSYFTFFCFAMLGIVFSDNLLMTFVFWEFVGLGSYLLIGFWYKKKALTDASGLPLSPAYAQKKAFVVNRVGDCGFALGLCILYWLMREVQPASPLSFHSLYGALDLLKDGAPVQLFGYAVSGQALLTLAGVLVFCGCIGKSAQFPLHVWLPDAMQGPTTVSSIIHAATMVAAGVYLTARMHPLLTDEALLVVALVGGVTAFLAATIALVQWDIKAVLAYSTISQLGYMMLGLGSAAGGGELAREGYTAGVLHLFTHAFFKCLLFLCAGAVIHACTTDHHRPMQDLFQMGGLRRKMPWVFRTMLLGSLALMGVPFFSGFFSKDAIIASALANARLHGGWPRWLVCSLALLAAILTAFYTGRLLFLAFFGKPRDEHAHAHAHDPQPAWAGILPLVVLAVLTLQPFWSGAVLPWQSGADWLGGRIERPVVADFVPALPAAAQARLAELRAAETAPEAGAGDALPGAALHGEKQVLEAAHVQVSLFALLAVLLGLGGAWLVYLKRIVDPTVLRARSLALRGTFVFLSRLWFIDILYYGLLVRGVEMLYRVSAAWDNVIIDRLLIDGWARVLHLLHRVSGWLDFQLLDQTFYDQALARPWVVGGWLTGRLQNGKIQTYLGLTALAVALMALALWLV